MAARRRGLGDVFHYFIPEEEQREARERTRRRGAQASDPPPHAGLEPDSAEGEADRAAESGAPSPARRFRWCVPIDPRRPLSCALAVDLGVALRRSGIPVGIAAPFPPGFVRPGRAVSWRVLDDPEIHPLEAQLDALEDGECLLVLLEPSELPRRLAGLPPGTLDGLLLPVDATNGGLTAALAMLGSVPRELRVGVLLLARDDRAADAGLARAYARLEGAARRQLGLEIERLGVLPRDQESFRSLLFGMSVLDLDEESSSARGLRAVGRELARPSAARA